MDNHHGIRAGEHLDATGERKVVYCHQCKNEWWHDENGLICPSCDGEATEIIEPNNDPRDLRSPANASPSMRDLHNHSPWASMTDSDPDEGDIEEHVTRGADGSIMISQTIRSSPVRHRSRPEPARRRSSNPYTRDRASEDPNRFLMRQFEGIITNLVEFGPEERRMRMGGPGYEDHFPRAGEGSGPRPSPWDPLFDPTREEPSEPARNRNVSGRGFQFHTHETPFLGSRVTFTTGRLGGAPRAIHERHGAAPGDEVALLLSNLFGNTATPPVGDNPIRDGPAGRSIATQFPALLAALMNPANAASGDAVYTQEALDRVISQLMEAHPTSSSAPGPASPQRISSLPKRALTDKDLEGNKKVVGKNGEEEMKGECSVCMDDVGVGEEMVFLPCNHWFHDACASAWLSEHDSCPICRKAISPNNESNSNNNSSNGGGNGNGNEDSGNRQGILRRASGMGAGFGSSWGSNLANPSNGSSSSNSNSNWGGTQRSIFSSAGRRERQREREAERIAEEISRAQLSERAAYHAHIGARILEREQRQRSGRNGNGSGNDGQSRWTSSSSDNFDDLPSDGGSDRAIRGSRPASVVGPSSGTMPGNITSRRYSNYGRPMPQYRESNSNIARDISTSPPDRPPMPGAFSSTPPRRDSARSSRSGSGSGSANTGGGGGVFSWVRDRLPGGATRRGDTS